MVTKPESAYKKHAESVRRGSWALNRWNSEEQKAPHRANYVYLEAVDIDGKPMTYVYKAVHDGDVQHRHLRWMATYCNMPKARLMVTLLLEHGCEADEVEELSMQ